MKNFFRPLLILMAFLFMLPFAEAQSGSDIHYLKGTWVGKLKIQAVSLTFVINFAFDSKDSLLVTIDSPDQGARDIPTSEVTFKGDSIIIVSKVVRGKYRARINREEMRMEGNWMQSSFSLPLALSHQEGKYQVLRPQEPKPPFPYHDEDVTFENLKAGINLAGTLTIPEGTGPFPAVVLITGSGPQNRDEEIFQHKPFLLLADWLTRHGVVVLRYDDRGIAASQGDFSKATTFDFTSDAQAALNYLRSRKEVDTAKTGLIGHSEGGIISSILAAEDPSVKFIVMLAGTGLSGDKILLMQSALILKASGASDEDVAEAGKTNSKIYSVLKKEKDDAKAKKKIIDILKASNERTHKRNTDVALQTEQELESKTVALMTPWFRTFITLDPSKYLEKVHCPVLALDGNLDLQVPAKENLAAIEKALIFAGNSHFETFEFPNLNHLFQTAKTGLPDEYDKIEETIAPVVLEKISGWINGNLK